MRSLPYWLLLGLWAIAACSGAPTNASATPAAFPTAAAPQGEDTLAAEDTARRFLTAWAALDYPAMYDLLTPLTQDALPFETFADRYRAIWRQGAFTGLDFEIVSSLVQPRSAQIRYRIFLQSAVVGEIVRETFMELTRADGGWRIAWTDATILPELAEGNDLLLDVVTPTRANIYDLQGLALAAQSDVVALWVVPDEIGDAGQEATMLTVLSELLGERPDAIRDRYETMRGSDSPVPVGEVSLLSFRAVEAQLAELSGVQWSFYNGRYYLSGGLAAHAVGYVGQITEEALEVYQSLGYEGDEFVGQIGLESAFEAELRGQPGGTLYLRDPSGRILSVLASSDAGPPSAVYTTIDRDLQRQAQEAIRGFRGAIVVLERDTGAVRALVSSPAFDPNLFNTSNPNSAPGLARLFDGTRQQPLLNRATSGLYPLGSVFKMVSMSAALTSELYTPDSLYTCNGEFRELGGGAVLYDWTVAAGLPDHGTITLMEGLERSCNPYFWHIGLDLFNQGFPNALSDMSTAFGLGQPTGIDVEEASGQVPTPEWKLQALGEEWSLADAVQLAIGQSALTVTPLQVARYVAAIGNGGTLFQPRLVDRVQNAEGEVLERFLPQPQGRVPVSDEHLAAIQQAMTQVVRAPGGTARHRFLGLTLNVAGKTGTAETGGGAPHAWFAGYTFEARADRPDVAVVVLVENQGEGSVWAAPIFRRVVEIYFFGQPFMPYPWESQIGVTRTPVPTETPAAPLPSPTPDQP